MTSRKLGKIIRNDTWDIVHPYLIELLAHFIIFAISFIMIFIFLTLTSIFINIFSNNFININQNLLSALEIVFVILDLIIIIISAFYFDAKFAAKKRNKMLHQIKEKEKKLLQEIESKTIDELRRNDARSKY